MSRTLSVFSFLALLLMALDLGPSFAHVLEAPPRLTVWSPELWRETTVFNRQFVMFAAVGAPLEIGTIIVGAVLTFLLRRERPAFWFVLAATLLFVAALATWFGVVAPVNAVLAEWQPGPIPENFEALRNRWETGHIAVATIKTVGLGLAIAGVLSIGRGRHGAAAHRA